LKECRGGVRISTDGYGNERLSYIKEKMDTIIIVTVAVLSYLYFWDFDEQG